MSDEPTLPKATVHGPTGTLCVHGIRLTTLTKKFKWRHFSTHAVFLGDFLSITAPHDSGFDDSVYFLRGFDALVALRPVRKDTSDGLPRNDLFTFVGLCYVTSFDLITLQVSDHEADIADDIAQISQWTVLHGSTDFLGGLRTENTQAMYLKLAEMCSAAHMQYSAWQITFLKNLRDRINLIWDDVLHRFKKEPFALTDASAPYHWRTPILLPDLIKAFGGQSDFWSMIIGQLITASISSDEETKEKIRQERRRLQALRKNMSLLSVTCKATETETALNARISEELDLLARDRLLYIQQLHTRRQREGDRYCPRWYDFAGISFYWYNMRHIHADKAADYIEQALAYMDIAHTENSITAASVLRANIDAATEYRRATRIASMEVKLTAKSLELPMLETDPEEKMDD